MISLQRHQIFNFPLRLRVKFTLQTDTPPLNLSFIPTQTQTNLRFKEEHKTNTFGEKSISKIGQSLNTT